MFRRCFQCRRIYGCKPADYEGNYDFKQTTHGLCDDCHNKWMERREAVTHKTEGGEKHV
jgi:hypothetical protein